PGEPIGDRVGQHGEVAGRHDESFGPAAVGVEADDAALHAEHRPAARAPAALAAREVAAADDAIADREAVDLGAELSDTSGELMPEHHGVVGAVARGGFVVLEFTARVTELG